MLEAAQSIEEILNTAPGLLQCTFVPRVSSEKPCGEEDFREYRLNVEKNFKKIKEMLCKIFEKSKEGSDLSYKIDNSFKTTLLLLCAEHSSSQPWSTSGSVKLSRETLDVFCELFSCCTVGEYLVGIRRDSENSEKSSLQTQDLFKLSLLSLRPKLLKETWKCFPAAVVAFQWLLFQVRFPHLTLENHGMVFTTSLIILDDFVSENKITGVKCLHHYTENVTATDFRCHGRDVVVYDALFSQLYTREVKVLKQVLPSILTCLIKMEPVVTTPDKTIISYVYQWGRFEDVLNNIFSAMIMDERHEVRMVYLKILPQFITARGIRVVLFTSKIISVLDSYLETRGRGCSNLIQITLEVFQIFMKTIQPRLPAHALDILQILLRKLQDLSSRDCKFEEGNSEVIIHLLCENVKFLVQGAPVHFSNFSRDYIKSLGLNETATCALMRTVQ